MRAGDGGVEPHPTVGVEGPERRRGVVATAVLGTPHPRRGGLLGACPVLLDEPGETRVRRAAGGLAVVVGASGWAVCAGDGVGGGRHRAVGWGFTPRGCAVDGAWWGGTPPYGR